MNNKIIMDSNRVKTDEESNYIKLDTAKIFQGKLDVQIFIILSPARAGFILYFWRVYVRRELLKNLVAFLFACLSIIKK